MHRVKQVVWSAVAAMAVCVSGAARADNHVLVIPPTGNAALSIAHAAIQNAPAQAGAMTIEFWIRCDSIAAVHGNAVAKRGCSNSGYTIQVRPEGAVRTELGGISNADVAFPLHQWAHFAMVWSRTMNTVVMYVNGNLAGTVVAFGPSLEQLTTELRFGEYCGRSMAGALDNVRIWSVARTQAEIDANKSRQFTPSEAAATPGLVGAWSFESGDGLSDDAGRNPTGVLQGGASVTIDNFLSPPCPGDVDSSGVVNGIDLAIVLANWGVPNAKYPRADINGDGLVDGVDLATVLAGWGGCP